MTSAAIAPYRTSHRLVLADLLPGAWVRDIALVAAGAGLTGVAAQASIHTPWTPVPFTLQTLAVLLVGTALGSVRGLLSMSLYLLAGVAGVPWFAAHGHGWGGPSFGYLIGFGLAATVAGALAERRADRSIAGTIALMVLGNLVIYAVGASWLAVDLHLSAATAFDLGVRPFLGSDLAKTVLAALALPATWRLVGRR
ncbi:biotin transporter BioY [Jatrophihabitans telluris]|uniref:Biotin transporter n=1 Tax=Jatrophihabitans telluris TaxID=2038343 RepID=A0ABY4R0G5_9ACTN|nr:biotin transporter BioY [Jatrophihabitans telluris]UQX89083.1 biotin transporter BioY [Jatrophihabitans telluris]